MTRDPDRSAFFIALVVVDVLVGLADAISGPYTILFLVDQAGLGPLSLSAILTARALSGIVFATAFGAWVDRRTSVRPLLLALAGSSVGYGLLAFTTKFAGLLFIAAGPIALGGAASPNRSRSPNDNSSAKFSHDQPRHRRPARELVARLGHRAGHRGARRRPVWLSRRLSHERRVRRDRALTLALAPARPISKATGRGHPAKPANGRPTIALAFAALALFHTAMFMGSIPLPIVLTRTLGGTETDVGLALSLCAALEIVVMGALIWRPLKRGERPAIVVGFAAFAAYFVALALARSVSAVLWTQILRAAGIALVSYLGISFLQSLLPHRAGAAAALFSNAGQVGSVAAALGAGLLAQAFGWTSVFVACAVLSVAGLVLVWLAEPEPN